MGTTTRITTAERFGRWLGWGGRGFYRHHPTYLKDSFV